MSKTFNPSVKKVTTIGEELRFQREYYCYKNSVSLPLKVNSTVKKKDERKSLQDILFEFMQVTVGDNSEIATSYDVLYAIENGRSKKKSDPYNPNTYFLRMFYLFKIYGFLDSKSILNLLEDKYELEPSFQSSKEIIKNIEKYWSVEEMLKRQDKGNLIRINIKYGKVLCSKDTFLKLLTKESAEDFNKGEQKYISKKTYDEKMEQELFDVLDLFDVQEFLWLKHKKEDLSKELNNITKLKEMLKSILEKYNIELTNENIISQVYKILKNYHIAEYYIDGKIFWISKREKDEVYGYDFKEVRSKLQEKMKKLSTVEKYCVSLELGRESTYIDSFIQNDSLWVTIDLLIKTLKYFEMENSRFYKKLFLIKEQFDTQSIMLKNIEIL